MTFVDLRDIFNFVFDSVNNALRVNVVAGSGGGGGAVTVADGADVALGTTTDPSAIGDVNGTVIAHLRGISEQIEEVTTGTNVNVAGAVTVSNFPATQPVSGIVAVSNFPATQPVSGTVTANQGAQAASGGLAGSWFVQGPTGVGGPIAARPFQMAGENSGNVALLHISSIGSVIADQGIQGAGGTASWQVQGPVASGAAGNATNPVLMGGVDPSNNNAFFVGVAAISDNQNLNSREVVVISAQKACNSIAANSTNFDSVRNNVDATLLASASRTTTQTSADIVTYNLQAITVTLNMTNVGTGSVTVSINGKDPASGVYYNLLTGAPNTTNGANTYFVDPAIPGVANVNAQRRLPRIIQIVVTANNANPATYSEGYTLHSPGG